jgi:hypothetical protein
MFFFCTSCWFLIFNINLITIIKISYYNIAIFFKIKLIAIYYTEAMVKNFVNIFLIYKDGETILHFAINCCSSFKMFKYIVDFIRKNYAEIFKIKNKVYH